MSPREWKISHNGRARDVTTAHTRYHRVRRNALVTADVTSRAETRRDPPTASRKPEPRDRDQRTEARRSRPSSSSGPATPTFAPCATTVDRSARPELTRCSRQRRRGRSPSITGAHTEHAQAVCPVWPTTATPCTPTIVTRVPVTMTVDVEPKLRDIRRARGVANAPCQRPRNPSTRHPPLPNLRPCSPRPREPDVTIKSTRSRSEGPAAASCVATDGADNCRASRQRACLRSTPRSDRGRSHEPPALHHVDVHTRDRTPKPVLLSKRSHLPIALDRPNRSCRRRRRRARPLEFALHRQFRTVIARRSDLHRVGANSNPAVADASRNPRLPSETEAAKSLETTPDILVRCHHRAATWLQRKLHSAGTCRAGEPVRRAPVPHVSQSWKDARQRPHRCCHRRSRREAPVEPKIHRSNATSHE